MNAQVETIALALGSNLGDRRRALRDAVAELGSFITITAVSPVYETAPAYVADQPAFLNAAVLGKTGLEPPALLQALKGLEKKLGRAPSFQYGPRLIDLDIIFYGDRMLITPELVLPHPRMAEREFVLRPLADIAPHWQHPENGLMVTAMLEKAPHSGARCLGQL